ncbi:GDNF-inducible zinc finger protein 1-like isoform X1 [Schistocerca nitens]|uniref:GDNF-inducible zinc finger protein 1-like isoform X1 n=2 Tax=Schistocerca nitens TaxID=7011 RepID=UPI0021173DFC|nr:GDNF-inducible zinc finger protein 1-like isoform X1 [Schistocerca nitens]
MKTYSRRKPIKLKDLIGICRLCLSSDGDRRCIFMDEEDIPLSVKIMTCASVQVSEGDGMPSEVCYNCMHQLESSYRFRQKCEEADTKLRKLLRAAKDAETNQREFHETDFVSVKSNLFNLQITATETTEKSTTLFVCSSPNHSNSELISSDIFPVNKSLCPTLSDSTTIDCKSSSNPVCDLSDLLIPNVHKSLCNSSQVDTTTSECELEAGEKQQSDDSLKEMENLSCSEVHPVVASTGDIHSQVKSEKNTQNSLQLPENCQNSNPSYTGNQPFIFSPTLKNEEITAEHLDGSKAHLDMKDLGNVNCGSSGVVHCRTVSDYKLIFKCDKCPKRFSKRLDLKRHTSVHNQQRGFVCGICEKWCPNQTNFKRHERTHTGERPFSCKYCSKSFSQTAILNRHMMIHTGEKPFQCNACGKKFTQKESLKVHSRQHLSGNDITTFQYKCPFCEKSFRHQSGLSRHLMSHTGKTFSCNLCPKTFTDQSSLKRHLKRHFEIKS